MILTARQDALPPDDIPCVLTQDRQWTLSQKIAHRLGRRGDVLAAVTGRSFAEAANRACRDYGIDVILAEETQGWAYWIGTQTKVPLVVVLHGPWLLHEDIQNAGQAADQGRATREQRAFRSAAGILAPSQSVLDAVARTGVIAGKPQAVIANAFQLATPPPPAARDIGQGVLFVGRYDKHKGGDTALEAFAKIAPTQTPLTFVGPDRGFVRDDGTTEYLPEALARLPDAVRAQVHVTGRLNADTIAGLRQTHGIALIASRYENLNYTMLEAMAAGQAIVATDVGGLSEVLEHEETALLVPPDNASAMAKALNRLIADPELAARLGTAAQAQLAKAFHPRLIAEKTVTFLCENGIVS